ncbi:hypothetical protein IJH29_01760 [Candidatus Saccharibacteria bacterium]|nr:hypothetical protein [Candidatus Saccharibacteria bacterium]
MSPKEQPKTNSIAQKIATLDKQIQWFYSDDFSLDQAKANYEAAINLAKDIETSLESLKNDIKILGHDFSK